MRDNQLVLLMVWEIYVRIDTKRCTSYDLFMHSYPNPKCQITCVKNSVKQPKQIEY